jgi:hypothetical protein
MTRKEINNWLGKYFLLATASIGGFILTMKGTPAFPLEPNEVAPSLQIIIPLFVGQLTLIVKSFAQTYSHPETEIAIPEWLVKWPPLIAVFLIVLGVVRLLMLHHAGTPGVDGAADFRMILTFCVTLLNSTTIYIVAETSKEISEDKKINIKTTLE